MPKTVDHQERRRELAAATWRVILREGLDATTTRGIAREAGYSSGILAHYFPSKDHILLGALRLSHEQIKARFRENFADRTGLAVLREYLLDYVPLTEQQVRETHLEMSFWSRALVNEALRDVQREEATGPRRTVRRLVVDAQASGELQAGDPDDVTDTLLALADGLSVYALMYPERYPPERLTSLIDAQLSRWTLTARRSRRRQAG